MPLNIGMNQQSPVEFESWFAAIVSGMLSAWQQVIILILLLMVLILFCHYRTQHHQAAAHIEQLSRDLMRRDAQVRILTGHFNGLLARRELDNSNLQRSLDRDFARKSSELANKDQMIAAHYSAVKDCFKAQLSVSSSMDVQEWLQASVAKVGEISVDAADFLRAAFHTIDAETSNRLNIANEKLTRRDNSIRELRSQFNDVYAKLEQTSSSLQMSARDHQEAEKVHWRQVHELNEKISQEAQSRREWILKAKQADNQRDKAERAFRDLHAQQDLDTEKREAELQELQEEIKLLRSSVCEIEHQRHSPVAREVKSRTQSLETENLGLAHGLGKSRYLEGQTAHEGPGSSTGSAFRIAQGNGKHPRQRQAQEESHDSDKVTGSVSLGNGQVRAESTKASYGRQGVEEPRVE